MAVDDLIQRAFMARLVLAPCRERVEEDVAERIATALDLLESLIGDLRGAVVRNGPERGEQADFDAEASRAPGKDAGAIIERLRHAAEDLHALTAEYASAGTEPMQLCIAEHNIRGAVVLLRDDLLASTA